MQIPKPVKRVKIYLEKTKYIYQTNNKTTKQIIILKNIKRLKKDILD